MSKVRYIGNQYFIRRWFKWYLIDLNFNRPYISAIPVEYVSFKNSSPKPLRVNLITRIQIMNKDAQKKTTIIVGHQNLRDKFKEIMDRVAKGDEVIVIKGSKPVAKITKYEQEY